MKPQTIRNLATGFLVISCLGAPAISQPTKTSPNNATNNTTNNTKTTTDKFEKALAFTLRWEGGASNHPADSGGLTYKGITAATSMKFAGVSDPRKLTENQIKDIYFNHYFKAGNCGDYVLPLAVVCFDTMVGSGQWKFLQPPTMENNKETAKKIVQNRMKFRHQRVKEKPNQIAFLEGWLNRDKALAKYIESL